MIKRIKKFLFFFSFIMLISVSHDCFAATSDLLDIANSTYGMSFGNSYTPKFINSVADYVDTSTGNFDFLETDVTIPGKNGFDIQLKRRFNSYTSAGEFCEVEFGQKKKCLMGYTYPYDCTYEQDGVTKTARYNIFFYDESYIVGSELSDGFYAKVPSDNNIKSDNYGNSYVYPNSIILNDLSLNVAHYTRVKGEAATELYRNSYFKYGTESKSSKVSRSIANGWEIPIAGMALLDSNGEDGVGAFQNLDGEVYPFTISIYKTSSGRRGRGYIENCNYRYECHFVNGENVPETALLPNGSEYNFCVNEKNGTTYYFNVSNGGVPTFIAVSDKYGNMIYKLTTGETGYIDTYGNKITISSNGICINGTKIIEYMTETVNNDTLDPLGEFKYDNTNVLSVRKAEEKDKNILQSNNVTKFYMKNAHFYNSVSPFMSLPVRIEYPTGLNRYYTYGQQSDYMYKKDLGIDFYYISEKKDVGINGNSKNSCSYEYEFYSRYNRYPTYVTNSTSSESGKTVTTVLDDSGRPTKISEDCGGREIRRTFTYYTSNHEARVSSIDESHYVSNSFKGENTTSFNYDNKMNLISETNGDYVSTTEYDIGNFNIPVCHTVKKDAKTTIKTVNILTPDKKDIACQKTYENDSLKKTVHYTYNGEGRISSEKVVKSCACTSEAPSTVSDSDVLSDTEYTYVNPTAQNRLLTINKVLSGIKDADNNAAANIVSAAEYDVMGNEVSHTDGNGNTYTTQYDWLGRAIKQQNPDGGVTSINYNISDRTVNVTNPDGTVMKYVYNEWGDIDSAYITNYNANTSPVLLEKVTYDNKCRENSHIKYLDGSTTEYVAKTYDGFNRINRVTTVRNNKTISDVYYSYDYSRSDNNRPILDVTIDFAAINGYTPATVQNTYDYRGNLTLQQVKTTDKTISTSYKNDFLGNRISKTDSMENTTSYEYNYAGELLKTTDAMGNTVSSTYDSAGRKVADTDAKGNVTTYEYDSAGRNIKIISPFDESRTSETKLYYDSNSNITSTSVKNGDNSYSTKDTAYDNMNRPVFVKTYPSAGKTECVQYFYDIMGNVVSKVHGAAARLTEIENAPENASVTSYTYDRFNRLISETDALGKTTSYTYNLKGEMTSKTTPNGNTVNYTPNIFGKNNKVTYDGNAILYEYNMLGLVTKMTDSTGVTNYTYDRFGRLTKEEKNGTLKAYTYDDNSNITKFVLSGGGAEKLNISYGYDALNRLTSVTSGSNAAAYAYDKNSNVISLSMGNKINNTYTYNKANLITAQTDSVLGKTYALSYNVDGNISSINETGKPAKTFTYDNTGKLVSETSAGKYTAEYTFDNRQNRITKAYTDLADGANNAVINYTYNLKNQLVSEQKTCGSKLGITDYEYDFNGNLYTKTHREYDENPNAEPQLEISQTPSGIERYTFNALDMPVSANINGIETTYTYDGNNLRTSKTSNGATTEFLYDGANIVGEKTDTDVKTYIRGKEILFDSDGVFYHYDTHGSVSALANAQNEVLAQNTYDAYGTGNISQLSPFGYRGEYQDLCSGLIYLRNRYYDPSIGRFITEDPARDGANWYVYANNNPVKYSDPSGLDAIVANQLDNIGGAGHMSSFVQDNSGTWYFFYWGNDSVSLTGVDDLSILNDSEKINTWLEEKGLSNGKYKYNGFCYILGDFSESKDYYQNLADQFAKDVENNDIGWFNWQNKNYNLVTRNCTQETMKGLYKGKIGQNGEQTVKQIHNKSGYIIAVLPNENLYNLQNIYGSKTLNWWE